MHWSRLKYFLLSNCLSENLHLFILTLFMLIHELICSFWKWTVFYAFSVIHFKLLFLVFLSLRRKQLYKHNLSNGVWLCPVKCLMACDNFLIALRLCKMSLYSQFSIMLLESVCNKCLSTRKSLFFRTWIKNETSSCLVKNYVNCCLILTSNVPRMFIISYFIIHVIMFRKLFSIMYYISLK